MHLLFARFIGHFLYKEHYVSNPEPFDYLITQGMVQSETYVNKVTKGYEKPEDVEKRGKQLYKKGTNEEVEVKYVKMSKSKHNGVDPVDVIKQYGSDVVRIAMLMQCPPSNPFLYNKSIMMPAKDILTHCENVCEICMKKENPKGTKFNETEICKTNNKIIHDMEAFSFHNVITNIYIMLTFLEQAMYSTKVLQYTKNALLFLAPFAPIKTEELWNDLIQAKCIPSSEPFDKQTWPKEQTVSTVTAVIQVESDDYELMCRLKER